MIVGFYRVKGKGDFIQLDTNRPVRQIDGGCDNMFKTSNPYGGVLLSDEKQPGWYACDTDGYIYMKRPRYGQVCCGAFNEEQRAVLGFPMGGKAWFRTADPIHLMDDETFTKYQGSSREEKDLLCAKYEKDWIRNPLAVKKQEPQKV